MRSKRAKDLVLPHSKAKLDLYKSYLEKYLPILTLAKGINKINLYDIFCGVGLYKDGNIGSPLIAVEGIKKCNELLDSKGWKRKPIKLSINDGSKGKIENVKKLLENVEISNCVIEYHNLDADKMLDLVIDEVSLFDKSERSLVFIDPYGYSNIDKEKISNLLQNGYTELVLFLPTMQMYRFSEVVFNDLERKCYEDLRKFISSFLPNQTFNNVFEFIHALAEAFSFDKKYYSSSYYIQRDKGNYYAVFFITSNIYGLERMLEVKWKEDPSRGQGFQSVLNPSLFGDVLVEYDRNLQTSFLKNKILNALELDPKGLSNVDLYVIGIKNEFLPKHIISVLKELKSARRIITYDQNGIETNFGNAYYIDYEHFKKKELKIIYKLK